MVFKLFRFLFLLAEFGRLDLRGCRAYLVMVGGGAIVALAVFAVHFASGTDFCCLDAVFLRVLLLLFIFFVVVVHYCWCVTVFSV
jgi:hypothetical protein